MSEANEATTDDGALIVHNDFAVLRAHETDSETCWCLPAVLRTEIEIDRFFDDLASFGETHLEIVVTA